VACFVSRLPRSIMRRCLCPRARPEWCHRRCGRRRR
jgi:hypothetical protein